MNWKAALASLDVGEVRLKEPMRLHTSYRIGGPAEAMVFPETEAQLARLLAFLADRGVPYFALGRGTDLLVRDGGIPGVVIHTGRLREELRVEGTRVVAAAGVSLNRLCSECLRHGLRGLEFAIGIPGSLGGALAMNAGAHGGEIGRVVERVWALAPSGRPVVLGRDELDLGYRRSAIGPRGLVVTGAELALQAGDAAAGRALARRYLEHRRLTQPISLPNAGSVFKNPPGDYAARLIEAVGGKGRRCGDAQISPLHANFIVNLGEARAADVLQLIAWAQAEVERAFGVRLELEVKVVGVDL